MTANEINSVLVKFSDSWRTAASEVRQSFFEVLWDRQYGREALTDAWAWFYTGWCSHVDFAISEKYL
jgi:hypothetical protein